MENLRGKSFYLKIILVLLLAGWLGFLMANKIDLATADLGRHLKNGEWFLEHRNLQETDSPLYANFYSYTEPEFPVVNHHWGSGILFFVLYRVAGFSGLSIFYIFVSLVTFLVLFWIALKESDFPIAFIFSLLLIPLMAERREVRPEIFSYLFSSVFFFLLWLWDKKKISSWWLFLLPVLMALWVNLHIYFFLGFIFIGIYLAAHVREIIFSRLSDKEFRRKIRGLSVLVAVAVSSFLFSLVSPFGLKGLVYPFQIFKNYGYTIVENRSVSFVQNYGIINSNFFLIKAVLILIGLGLILSMFAGRKKISIQYFILALLFGSLGWLAIRNFTLLGLFALPVLAANFGNVLSGEKDRAREEGLTILLIVVFFLSVWANCKFVAHHWERVGIGFNPKVSAAVNFFKREKIGGPIFNNYDIGGYLIWYLFPHERVFVDNRPEAYSEAFFSQVYKPMQDDPAIFRKVDEKYNFNAIFFYRNDITPWAQGFFKKIAENENWAPVYRDDYAIIYLKKNEANKTIIEKYQIE